MALAACGGGSAPSPPPPAAVTAGSDACARLPFAESTPVPEASGAAWLTIAGKAVLVTMGDSGQAGAYGLIDPETGATLEQGQLPLGSGGGDDLEGIATRGGRLYAVTSAGWVRVWTRTATGFELVDGPYAVGAPMHGKDLAGPGMVCDASHFNCGRNYEGLALSEDAPQGAACIGVLLGKAEGTLYCLTEADGRLVARRDGAFHVGQPKALADVALDDHGALWVGANAFGLNAVWRVTGWRDLPAAKLEEIGAYGVGFSEGIAVRGDVLYRFSDMGGAPSLMAKFRCPAIQR